jgi:DNA-binding NarL/FixJ family response regulator
MVSQPVSKIKIVIVDDHPLFRQGLRQAMVSDTRLDLIGEAENGKDALDIIVKLAPDVAVLDVNLPDISGLKIATQLRDQQSKARLIFLTMLQDEAAFNYAMNVGAQGYLLKDSGVAEIVNCIVSVAAGIPYVSPSLSSFLLKRRDRASELAAHVPGLEDLTTAERRILKRIAEKKSTKEIAAELDVSPRTVETHRANISTKLELKGSNNLLQFAIEHRDALSVFD